MKDSLQRLEKDVIWILLLLSNGNFFPTDSYSKETSPLGTKFLLYQCQSHKVSGKVFIELKKCASTESPFLEQKPSQIKSIWGSDTLYLKQVIFWQLWANDRSY